MGQRALPGMDAVDLDYTPGLGNYYFHLSLHHNGFRVFHEDQNR